jgi:hypothetical protein
VKLASQVAVDDGVGTKSFSADEFRKIMRSNFFVGATEFWRQLERIAGPETLTRIHAMGVLKELAESSFADCGGRPYSPQQADCLRYCGFEPIAVRPPGATARES